MSLDIRRQKYKKNRLKGMNIENAARAAGYSQSYCRARAYRLDRLVSVGMTEAFERAGLTDKAIVEHALEGLSAMKVVNADVYNEDGENDKEQSALREVKDWNARHKYFETILKLTDRLKEKSDKPLQINLAIGTIHQLAREYDQSITATRSKISLRVD